MHGPMNIKLKKNKWRLCVDEWTICPGRVTSVGVASLNVPDNK